MPPSRRSSSSSSSRSGGPSRRSSSSSYRSSSSSYRSSSYRSSSSGRSFYGGTSYRKSSYGGSSWDGDPYRSSSSDDYSLADALEDMLDQVPRGVYGDSYIDTYDGGREYSRKRYESRPSVEKKQKPQEPKKAHFICEFCDSELEEEWKEGFYPTCKNCGAQMTKQTQVAAESGITSQGTDEVSMMKRLLKKKTALIPILLMLVLFLPQFLFGFQACVTQKAVSEKTKYSVADETNLQIYGTRIFLGRVSDDAYKISTSYNGYEKYIDWDYGIRAYYDAESNCYLWYNTDVSPNVWQYWYDDIAGDNYYGWMEYAEGKWYIETSETEWVEYTGDTSGLWHIVD